MCIRDRQYNVNPVKRLWEAKEIRFPGRGILPNSSSTPTSSSCTATLGAEPLFYSDFALPLTFEQEKKYLELGINESLRSSSSTVKHTEESAITNRCSSEPDVWWGGRLWIFIALYRRKTDRRLIWRLFVQFSVKLPTKQKAFRLTRNFEVIGLIFRKWRHIDSV